MLRRNYKSSARDLRILMWFVLCYEVLGVSTCQHGAFDDTPSRTVKAHSVYEARARGHPTFEGSLVTIKFKMIKPYKGELEASMISGDITVRGTVGQDAKDCVSMLKSGGKYLVYLNGSDAGSGVRWMSSLPEVFHARKEREIKDHSCTDCKKLPTAKAKPSKLHLMAGQGIEIECHVTGRPEPQVAWYRGPLALTGDDPRTDIVTDRQFSKLKIHPVDEKYSGQYRCEATNVLGSTSSTTTVLVEQGEKPPFSELCPPEKANYCKNNGICWQLNTGQLHCRCAEDFEGPRCDDRIMKWDESKQSRSTLGDHPLAFAGLILGVIIFIVMLILICYVVRKTSRLQGDGKLTPRTNDMSAAGQTALPINGDVIHATRAQELACTPERKKLVDIGTQTEDAPFKELPQVLVSTLNELNNSSTENIYNGVVMRRPKGSPSTDRRSSSITRPRLSAISNTPGIESQFPGFDYPNSSPPSSPASSAQTLAIPEHEQTASQNALTSMSPVGQRSETLQNSLDNDDFYDNLIPDLPVVHGNVDKCKINNSMDDACKINSVECKTPDGFSQRLATEPGSRHLHPNYSTKDYDWQRREQEVQALLHEFGIAYG